MNSASMALRSVPLIRNSMTKCNRALLSNQNSSPISKIDSRISPTKLYAVQASIRGLRTRCPFPFSRPATLLFAQHHSAQHLSFSASPRPSDEQSNRDFEKSETERDSESESESELGEGSKAEKEKYEDEDWFPVVAFHNTLYVCSAASLIFYILDTNVPEGTIRPDGRILVHTGLCYKCYHKGKSNPWYRQRRWMTEQEIRLKISEMEKSELRWRATHDELPPEEQRDIVEKNRRASEYSITLSLLYLILIERDHIKTSRWTKPKERFVPTETISARRRALVARRDQLRLDTYFLVHGEYLHHLGMQRRSRKSSRKIGKEKILLRDKAIGMDGIFREHCRCV